jgi:sortase A
MAQSSLTAVEPVTAVTAMPQPSASTTVPPARPEPVAEALYSRRPELNERIGTITLPTLKLSWPIFEGTTNQQLDKGVGHYVNSVLPGVTDNSVLSGHRTSVFNRLGELKIGDEIYVETSAGVFTYRVELTRVVKRTDRTVIVPTSTAILTLTTCWPFNHAGITTQAYIVTASLQ